MQSNSSLYISDKKTLEQQQKELKRNTDCSTTQGDARRGLVRAAVGKDLISSQPQRQRNGPLRALLEAGMENR